MKIQLIIFLALVMGINVNAQEVDSTTVLTLGDSNGAAEHGWVNQVKVLKPDWQIINASISGNTVGFDNLEREELNTLKNLDAYLNMAMEQVSHLDYIVILLGTNDAKAVFKDRQDEVLQNMNRLIERLKSFIEKKGFSTEIVLVTPPPYGPDEMLLEKYMGGNKRVQKLAEEYKKISEQQNVRFVNIYSVLKDDFEEYSPDGVHLTEEGQQIIAGEIIEGMLN
jgi:lysophospholipase L1-like esterase